MLWYLPIKQTTMRKSNLWALYIFKISRLIFLIYRKSSIGKTFNKRNCKQTLLFSENFAFNKNNSRIFNNKILVYFLNVLNKSSLSQWLLLKLLWKKLAVHTDPLLMLLLLTMTLLSTLHLSMFFERLRQSMKRYYEENKEEYKIVNIDAMPFNELRVLNLSFQGK